VKISLRRLNEFDLECFSKWLRDKELLDSFFPGTEVPTKEEVLLGFATILNNKKDVYLMIIDKEKPIGMISLLRDKVGSSYKIQILIGEKDYWYRGCDVEALRILTERIKHKDMNVYMEVKPESEKSIAVFTSLGFVAQKVKKCPRDKLFPRVLRMDFTRKDVDFLDA
jgi:RimJ/RimL family protein N-acetyltransferase